MVILIKWYWTNACPLSYL